MLVSVLPSATSVTPTNTISWNVYQMDMAAQADYTAPSRPGAAAAADKPAGAVQVAASMAAVAAVVATLY